MDAKCSSFKKWYLNHKEKWFIQDIVIEKSHIEKKYGHHYSLDFKTNRRI